jgi:hypothetical protein
MVFTMSPIVLFANAPRSGVPSAGADGYARKEGVL